MTFKRFVLLVCTFFTLTSAYGAVTEVISRVDKNPLMTDEAMTLAVMANDNVERNQFDASILAKDFHVGPTSVSTQTQIINGQASRTTTWQTTLIPKEKGRFTIPSFNISGVSSEPIDVMVIPASQNNNGRNVYITSNVDLEENYVQQQLTYTVKLHLGVDLQSGSLSQPTVEGAEITQLGKDKEYSEIIDGKRYRIIERNYAIIPQRSGPLSIQGPLFEGDILRAGQRSYSVFSRTQNIKRVAPTMNLNVLPIPDNYTHHWLPSEFVQVNDEWQTPLDQMEVGQPVTRTITLTALGVAEEQLPELTSAYPAHIKTYPDQANTATVERDKNIVAQRVENIALIPGKEGTFSLPEIRIPWFNTLTKQTEYAVVPATQIKVKASATGNTNSPANVPAQPPALPENNIVEATQDDILPPAQPPTALESWWAWSTWLFLALWILTALLWYWHSKKTKVHTQPDVNQQNASNRNMAWKSLQNSINEDSYQHIPRHLRQWLSMLLCMPDETHLSDLLRKLNHKELTDSVDDLFASLYGKQTTKWKSDGFKEILQKIDRNTKLKNTGSKGLDPLFPSH